MELRKNTKTDRRIDATMNLDKSFENLAQLRKFHTTISYKET